MKSLILAIVIILAIPTAIKIVTYARTQQSLDGWAKKSANLYNPKVMFDTNSTLCRDDAKSCPYHR
jgi:hypothetical protein